MIVDVHTHVDDVPALGWWPPLGAVLAQLDEAGIDRAVVMTIVDAPALHPDARIASARGVPVLGGNAPRRLDGPAR